MTGPTTVRLTGTQLVLRAMGVAFGSALVFLLMAAADGHSATAEASSSPVGLGDVTGDGSGIVVALATPAGTVGEVVPRLPAPATAGAEHPDGPISSEGGADTNTYATADLVTSIATAVASPVGIGHLVADIAEPVAEPVGHGVAPVIAPVVDVAAPRVEPVDEALPPGGGPTADVVAPGDPAADPGSPADPSVSAGPENPPTPGQPTRTPVDDVPLPAVADSPPPGSAAPAPEVTDTPSSTSRSMTALDNTTRPTRSEPGPENVPPAVSGSFEPVGAEIGRSVVHLTTIDGSATADSSGGRPAPSRSTSPFGPLRPTVPNVVSGALSIATSFPPDGGGQPTLLAVLAATVAAMLWFSRRVTAEVSWRSAIVLCSVERPG